MDFIFFLLPVFIAMTISIFMTKRWGMGEKVDKGIAFCYWKKRSENEVRTKFEKSIEENLLEHYG